MAHKHLFLTILSMVLLMLVLVGCSPTQAEPTPTLVEPSPTPIVPTLTLEDPSIVWSDDFEDGDLEGWEDLYANEDFAVNEGVLTVGPGRGGDILHKSEVQNGTWSFDVFMPEDLGSGYFFGLSFNKPVSVGYGIKIGSLQETSVKIFTLDHDGNNYEGVWLAEGVLTGWNHFDVTRDDQSNFKVFLNGQLILESIIESGFTPAWFWFSAPPKGPALDNLVVRNQVIDIQPTE